MKKAGKQIALGALLLLLFCAVCRVSFFQSHRIYFRTSVQEGATLDSYRVVSTQPGIVDVGTPEIVSEAVRVPVFARRQGETDLTLLDRDGNVLSFLPVRVSRFLTLYDAATGGFTGDSVFMVASTLFWLMTGGVMLRHFRNAKGAAFYQHMTIYFAGFSLFSLVTGLCLLEVTIRHLSDPVNYPMYSVYSALSGASTQFMLLTSPLFILFSLTMAVSNIVLLRRERPRLRNVFALGISLLLILGVVGGLLLIFRDFSGSEWENRIRSVFENAYSTVFVYWECMLAGSVISGITAARRRPAPDKDFIVILGCWFRKDGSLPPLLRGRVDRALDFWREQKEQTGKEALFIPSGGQGPDESMPEAEAMRRYLLSRDVPEELIVPETASKNTFENMAFSKKIIRRLKPESKVVFSTTSYHVFRSGIWASKAGLFAEGIGSKTKWWFWPNAFMRETVSLLQSRWKQEILLLILLLGYFTLLTFLLN
ncbi:MAG: YdcF family protein [Clostridia bacterium]|nr:YdcF family protein [Clostridia bacterium]